MAVAEGLFGALTPGPFGSTTDSPARSPVQPLRGGNDRARAVAVGACAGAAAPIAVTSGMLLPLHILAWVPAAVSARPASGATAAIVLPGAIAAGRATPQPIGGGLIRPGSTITTTTTLTGTTNPSIYGQKVLFRVTVAGSQGTPTGTVILMDGASGLGSGTLAGGAASVVVPPGSLSVGTQTITAAYSGAGSFGASSGTLSQTVVKAGSVVRISRLARCRWARP